MAEHLLQLRVAARVAETADIVRFELVLADGALLPPFTAGAHIDVHVETAQGGTLVRQYSLCNAPSERQRWEIAVLDEPQSRGGSRAMHRQVQVGDVLQVSTPRSHFALVDDGVPHGCGSLLLAGGIGITPLLAMAERLAQAGAEFVLHYAARSADRMAFRDRLAAAPWTDRVRLHADDGPWAQRLDIAALLRAQAPGTHLYVCGPAGLIQAALAAARALGWAEHRLHREHFGADPAAQPSPDADAAFDVQLARSGRTITVPRDRSVADALQAVGIVIPVSCAQGVCGTCLTGVLSGQPDHRDLYLTPDEQAANDRFTPCCSRAKSPQLVLDL